MRFRGSRGCLVLACLAVVPLLAGCAAARYGIKTDGLKYAASLSPVLQDAKGRNLYLNEDLAPLGDFEFTRRGGMGGSVVDLSDQLNQEVERRKGEGIVNLAFTVANTLGGQTLTVTGTVVKAKDSRAGAREKTR